MKEADRGILTPAKKLSSFTTDLKKDSCQLGCRANLQALSHTDEVSTHIGENLRDQPAMDGKKSIPFDLRDQPAMDGQTDEMDAPPPMVRRRAVLFLSP